MEEKRQKKEQERLEDQMYANQSLELNRMRGMLEDNFHQTKADIRSDHKEYNQRLDLELKQKEEAEKQTRLQYQRDEADYLKKRGVKQ